jgi:hypothetical protein
MWAMMPRLRMALSLGVVTVYTPKETTSFVNEFGGTFNL